MSCALRSIQQPSQGLYASHREWDSKRQAAANEKAHNAMPMSRKRAFEKWLKRQASPEKGTVPQDVML